jgi:hypothetical protein
MLPVTLYCPFLIGPSVFSNVYFLYTFFGIFSVLLMIEIHYLSLLKLIINLPEEFDPDKTSNGDIGL